MHSGLKVWQSSDGKWANSSHSLTDSEKTLNAVSKLLKRGAMKKIFDFDNYLDDVGNDWTNQHFNFDLDHIMSMP